jgi:hypothetical protein
MFPDLNLSCLSLENACFADTLTPNFNVPNTNQDVPSGTRCDDSLMAVCTQLDAERLAVKLLVGLTEQIGVSNQRPKSE